MRAVIYSYLRNGSGKVSIELQNMGTALNLYYNYFTSIVIILRGGHFELIILDKQNGVE